MDRRILLALCYAALLVASPGAIAQAPTLRVTATGPEAMTAGSEATFVLTVTYEDGVGSTTVNVTASDPSGASFVLPSPAPVQAGSSTELVVRMTTTALGDHQVRFEVRAQDSLGLVAQPAIATRAIRVEAPPQPTPSPTQEEPTPAMTPAPPPTNEPVEEDPVAGSDPVTEEDAGGIAPPPGAPTAAPGPKGAPSFLLGAAGLALAAGGVLVFARRRIAAGLLLLYARIRPDSALDHPRRKALLRLASDRPGVSLSEAGRALGVANGVLRYHVDRLATIGVLTVVRHGQERHLYPKEFAPTAPRRAPLDELCLDALASAGPLAARQIAERVGASRQAVEYHLRSLARDGRVVLTRGEASLVAEAPRARSAGS